jgi:aminoglycoside phosphotransferase (APT) family kinase protein
LRLTRIGRGKSNLTLLAEDSGGASWVLRRPPRGHLLGSAHDVRREARVLAGIAASGVPAPRAIALCEGEEVSDAPLLLLERIDGVTLDGGSAAPGVEDVARGRIGPSMVVALASVHEVDLVAAGLDDLGRHDHYGARQLRRWSRQWEGSGGRAVPAVEEVARRLEEALPPEGPSTLVHGDFHPLNCLFDRRRGEVEAILDWELSTIGEPLADLGTLLAYWSAEREHPLGEPFAVTSLPGFSPPATLVAEYATRTGRDVTHLPFWEALANWKIAIIAEGVNQRHREDPVNPTGASEAAIDGLLRRASDLLALIPDQGARR